ncbi:MAG: response regulator transcription factor [Chloroflexota bacterium]|nr:response regulator transcription factor [Chloroflexota bacterium]
MPPTPSASQLRVLIVDPDRRVRRSLSSLICCLSDQVQVIGMAEDPASALAEAEAGQPQVAMIDPRLPDVDAGLALVAELRSRYPAIRIIVMGWADSLEYPAIARGADAFLAKTAGPNDFLDAIRRAWTLAA